MTKNFVWFIAIVVVLSVFSNSQNVQRFGANTVNAGEGINNTLFAPRDDPRSKTLLHTIIVIGGLAALFGAFKKKEEKK